MAPRPPPRVRDPPPVRGRARGRGRFGGRPAGRGSRLPPRGSPSPTPATTPEPEQERQHTHSPEVEHDWEQAIRMAAREGISQEAIEACILVARRAMFPQAVPLTAEGASPITPEAVVATPTGLTAQTRTEEYGIQQQLRHYDRLSPGYAGKGTAIDAED